MFIINIIIVVVVFVSNFSDDDMLVFYYISIHYLFIHQLPLIGVSQEEI